MSIEPGYTVPDGVTPWEQVFDMAPRIFDPRPITADTVRAALRKIQEPPTDRRVVLVPEALRDAIGGGIPGLPEVTVVVSEFVAPNKVYVFFEGDLPEDLRT